MTNYVPEHQTQPGHKYVTDFVERRAFGSVSISIDDKPMMTLVPFDVIREGDEITDLRFHLPWSNPQSKVIEGKSATVSIWGADAFINPEWYDHENVATWDYEFVSISGVCSMMNEDQLRALLEDLYTKFLPEKPINWEYASQYLDDIVGFTLEVNQVQPVFKLSQNKSAASLEGVIAGLKNSDQLGDQALAQALRRFYQE